MHANLFHGESDKNKQRVENPNADRRGLIRQWRARNIRVADLDDDQGDAERDHSSLANCRHDISSQVKSDPAGEQCDLECKLRVTIIPQTKTDLRCVVVDREIAGMRDEIENPM